VPEVGQKVKLALAALAGAAVGAALQRRRQPAQGPVGAQDTRAEDLRRKLAEARAAFVEEEEFEAAGMGAETLVEEPPQAPAERPAEEEATEPPTEEEAPEPPAEEEAPEPPAEEEAPADAEEPATPEPEPEPAPEAEAEATPQPAPEPPRDEFEAMRRRIHEEAKAAAEEMRSSADPPEKP
jgi:hypothetical protein